jgi:hypothetical protein
LGLDFDFDFDFDTDTDLHEIGARAVGASSHRGWGEQDGAAGAKAPRAVAR